MAHFQGRLGQNMVVLYIMSMLVVLLEAEGSADVEFSSWYLGCADITSLEEPFTQPEPFEHPTDCAKTCLNMSHDYAALSGNTCHCLGTINTAGINLSETSCSQLCGSPVAIPCGEADYGSVYYSQGPFLVELSALVMEETVYQGQPLSVKVTATLAEQPNITLGIPGVADTAHRFSVRWSSLSANVSGQKEAVAQHLTTNYSFLIVLESSGSHSIDIEVRNILSLLTVTVTIVAYDLEPNNIQLNVLTSEENQPACTPGDMVIPDEERVVSVFTNIPVTFEAYVDVGVNLTFHWTFQDVTEEIVIKPYLMNCLGRNCTATFQEHVFTLEGTYQVQVSATYGINHVMDTLIVAAVEKNLSNASISLVDTHPLMATHSTAKFLISMENTDRHGTLVELNFGGGIVKKYLIWPEGHEVAAVNHARDVMYLAATYGTNCLLQVIVEHVYLTQGIFRPSLLVSNNVTDLDTHMKHTLEVLNQLQQAQLQGPTAAELNKLVNFSVTFLTSSLNISFFWSINNAQLKEVHNMSTEEPAISHRFAKPGSYSVSIIATNRLGSVNASLNINVQVRLVNLTLSLVNYASSAVATRQIITFQANLSAGSDVKFVWDFSDPHLGNTVVVERNLSSRADHTFLVSGNYTVTVVAKNLINQIITELRPPLSVQDPVLSLVVDVPSTVLLGNSSHFIASVSTGSNIHFDIDLEGRRHPMNLTSGYRAQFSNVFSSVGSHNVTVYAYNNVSQLQEVVAIDVEEGIPTVLITQYVRGVKNEPSICVARLDGILSTRSDLVYRWTVEHNVKWTRAPLFEHIFQAEGDYDVSVIAYNEVAQSRNQALFTVRAVDNTTRFLENSVSQFGEPTNFLLKNFPLVNTNIFVYFGDGIEKAMENLVGPEINLTHTYSQPGIYQVGVNLPIQGHDMSLETAILIEEPVGELTLTGPAAVPLNSIEEEYSWRVAVTGTHLVYEWTVGHYHINTTRNKITHRFNEPARINVTVKVSNCLGSKFAWMLVSVEYRVEHAELEVAPTLSGQHSDIYITVYGGPFIVIALSFGDDNYDSLHLTPEDGLRLTGDSSEEPDHLMSYTGPVYRYHVMSYLYGSTGIFEIIANVSNRITGNIRASAMAVVQEPIDSVEVYTTSPLVVATGQHVEVVARAGSGLNLQFDWDFYDISPTPQEPSVTRNDNRSSIATYIYSVPGTYNVMVFISNDLYEEAVEAMLPEKFTVVELIEQVTLVVESGSNFVEFDRISVGVWETEEVVFEVSVSRGSDLTYLYDFGDNHQSSEPSHIYTSVGDFNVSVTVSNALGEQTVYLHEPFAVQIKPHGLTLGQRVFYMRFGNWSHFEANISSGTDVQFQWDMGDGTLYRDKGLVVAHHYLNSGVFSLRIYGYNHVGTVSAEAQVLIIEAIQGIDLSANTVLEQTNVPITFTATPYPPNLPQLVQWYEFDFDYTYLQGSSIEETLYNTRMFSYPEYGWYTVHVTARNRISHKMSGPLQVHIVEPLSEILIYCDGEPILNHELLLHAFHWSGSNVTYTWDFGDNNVTTVTESRIRHTFNITGVFDIMVTVSNPLGSMQGHRQVFILEQFCKAPVINILTDAGLQIMRSHEVKVEANVIINCSITSNAVFHWTIYNATTSEPYNPVNLPQSLFRDANLILPPKTLPYGNFTVQLHVSMEGTIVYAIKRTHIRVTPTPLLPVIRGGIQRLCSRAETVVMDGTLSSDPDFPENRNFSFSWICHKLNYKDESCFLNNNTAYVNQNSSVLHIPGHEFINESASLVFTLSLSSLGRRMQETAQVLNLQDELLINVALRCEVCENGVVNADQRLVFEVLHPGIMEADLIYYWNFSYIRNDTAAYHHGDCVKADGSVWNLHAGDSPDTSSSESNSTTDGGLEQTDAWGEATTELPLTTMEPVAVEQLTTTLVVGIMPGLSPGGRPAWEVDIDIAEADPDDGVRESGSSPYDDRLAEDPSGGARTPSSPGDMIPAESPVNPPSGTHGLEEAPASGSGGSGGRGLPSSSGVHVIPESPGTGGRPSTSNDNDAESSESSGSSGGTQGGKGDPYVDADAITIYEHHIISVARVDMVLLPEQTTTGLGKRVLVLREDVLKQGIVYFAKINVQHKTDNRKGSALVYFRVNESPINGKCTISPSDGGVELDTIFLIYCREWFDSDKPIRYEVSYMLNQGDGYDIIYQGLSNRIEFQLPAGNPDNGYEVDVHISILDSQGARTSVCSLPLRVTPKQFNTTLQTEEEILYDIVKENASILQTYVSTGDNRNARLQAQMVALRLNRLNRSQEATAIEMRQKIRRAMLYALYDLPMRDQYELQQTTSAVTVSTAVAEELNGETLLFASDIIQRAVRQVNVMANTSEQLDASIVSTAIDGCGNVLAAASKQTEQAEGAQNLPGVVQKARQSINTLLKCKLAQTVLGEEPYRQNTEYLSTEAGRYRASEAATGTAPLHNFLLPSNMGAVLENNVRLKDLEEEMTADHDCYGRHAVTYKMNPFTYNNKIVEPEVASLTLFNCDGEELTIEDLPAANTIGVEIHHGNTSMADTEDDSLDWYTLYKHQMNVHQFNKSHDNANQSLQFLINLEPLHQGRLFPIALLLSAGQPPTPDNYILKREFPAGQNQIRLFLEPTILQDGEEYFIGIVDVDYNSGPVRPGEVTERTYAVRLWWGQCLYWAEPELEWRPDGCQMQDESTFMKTRCSCNHLTAFGVSLSLAPNDLSISNIDEFFNLNENPVTFSFIASLMVVYVILLVICIRKDLHDAKKGAIIHLTDNSPYDKQMYVITFETGFRQGSGTSGKVSLVLHGENGISETRELLSQARQPLFERNSRDTFIMTLPDSLGPIWKVQIWHNNAGLNPSWFLSRITVRDLGTGTSYYFSCEKWFAVEEEEGKIEREIMVLESGLGFSKVFWAKGTQYLVDYHIWLSTFLRPPHSRFTRAQRLTCCLSLLLSYMACNAAWYQYNEEEYRGEFGLIDVSWRSLAVGAITSVIVLPVNLFVVFVFRRSKVKRVRIEEPPEKYKKSDAENEDESDEEDEHEQYAPSIFDQSMLNWQNLQEWAQKQWAKRYENSINSSLNNIKPRPQVEEVMLPSTDVAGDSEDSPPPKYELLESTQDDEQSFEMTEMGMGNQENGSLANKFGAVGRAEDGIDKFSEDFVADHRRDPDPLSRMSDDEIAMAIGAAKTGGAGHKANTEETKMNATGLGFMDHVLGAEAANTRSATTANQKNGEKGESALASQSDMETLNSTEDAIKRELLKYGDMSQLLESQLKSGLGALTAENLCDSSTNPESVMTTLSTINTTDCAGDMTDSSSEGKGVPGNPAPSSVESGTNSEKSLPQRPTHNYDNPFSSPGKTSVRKPSLEHQQSTSSHSSTHHTESNASSSSHYYPVPPHALLSENSSEHCAMDSENLVTMDMRGNRSSVGSSATKRSYSLREYISSQKSVLERLHSGKPRRCFFPHWFTYIAWFLSICIIVGTGTITVLYGFRFGRMKSVLWLQSLFFSFLQCVFITHPVLILMMAAYAALKYRHDLSVFDHHDDGIINQDLPLDTAADKRPKSASEEEFDMAKGIAARQRSRYLRFARPPQEKHLIQSRKKTMKEKKTMSVLQEGVWFGVVLFLLLVVAFGKDLNTPYQLNTALKQQMYSLGEPSFKSVQTTAEWWRWSQTTLLDSLYWERWYNGHTAQTTENYVGNGILVGRISIRQVVVKPDPCQIPMNYGNLLKICQVQQQLHQQQPIRDNNTWITANEQLRHIYFGKTNNQIFLPLTRAEAESQLLALQQSHWLTSETEKVVVEMVLFYPPSNLFTSVRLSLDISPIGRAVPCALVKSTYLYKYMSTFDNFVLAAELLLLIVAMVTLHHEIEHAIKLRRDYIKNPWNCLQVCLLMLTLAYMACYIFRFALVAELVEQQRATYHEEFIDIAFVALWDELLRYMIGFIVFFVILHSLRLFRNRPVMAKIGGVYRKAACELATFGMMFIVWIFAFTSLSVALYATLTLDFSSFDLGLMAMVALLTRHYTFGDLEASDPTGCRLIVASFMIFALGILTGYVIAILTWFYHMYREEGMPTLSTVEAARHVWTRFRLLIGLHQQTQNDNDSNVLPPEFAMAEIQYQVEEMLFKMNALAGTCGLPEKPPMDLTDSDCTYTGNDGGSYAGSEFDELRLEQRIHKIEDSLYLQEPHLAQLLHLDAIGADVLSEEKEKQLRSQLELEIFRQLQMQRQDLPLRPLTTQYCDCHGNPAPANGSTGSSGSSPRILGTASTLKLPPLTHKPGCLSNSPEVSPRINPPHTRGWFPQTVSLVAKMADALMLQDISERSSMAEDAIPLQDIERKLSGQSGQQSRRSLKPNVLVETDLQDDPVSNASSSSGGIEIQRVLSRKSQRSDAKNKAMSHKSHAEAPLHQHVHAQVVVRNQPIGEEYDQDNEPQVHKLPELEPTKHRPKPMTISKHGSLDPLFDTSSSSSEVEFGLRPTKARSLRKTKSRGKGKGHGSLMSPLEGLDEFGFENVGYRSDTDKDKMMEKVLNEGASGDNPAKRPPKECWK